MAETPLGAHTDFAGNSYGDYLALDQLLGAQKPRSLNHNEMLFIVQHQTTELWLKLVLHELRAARRSIADDDMAPAFKSVGPGEPDHGAAHSGLGRTLDPQTQRVPSVP